MYYWYVCIVGVNILFMDKNKFNYDSYYIVLLRYYYNKIYYVGINLCGI